MATRYQRLVTMALTAHQSAPQPPVAHPALGSLGGALAAAAHLGEPAGAQVAHAARPAFGSGMDLGLRVGAILALSGALLALVVLSARPREPRP